MESVTGDTYTDSATHHEIRAGPSCLSFCGSAVLPWVPCAFLRTRTTGAGGASATRPDTTLPVRRDLAGRGIVRAGFARRRDILGARVLQQIFGPRYLV